MRLALAPGAGFQVRSQTDLDRYMRAVSEAGFDGMSLGLQHVEGCESAVASLLDRHGLRCSDVLPLLVGQG